MALCNGLDELQQRPTALGRLCFVPDCERVRANGGAAPTLPQGHPGEHEANPCFRPGRVFVPNPGGDPESAEGKTGVS